jgi:curved DNA-binding protein
MEFKDYYNILGVGEDADLKAIKTAYRRLARKYHPDVSDDKDAEARFKEVSEAYEVLSDEKKRAEYDQLRKYGRGGESFEPPPGWQGRGAGDGAGTDQDFSEFFSSIFGGGFARGARGARAERGPHSSEDFFSTRGRDVEVEMPVFLEETLEAQKKTIEYQLPRYDQSGRSTPQHKTLRVNIPAGVRDGERIRLKGQGAPGFGDGPAGDLYLRLRLVPHPLFDVLGRDLTITVPIAPWEAALGTRVTVPTLDGRVQLTIKPDSQTGQRLRLRGKGLRHRKQRGDLFAVLKIVMPDRTDAEARSHWEALAEKQSFNPRSEWENAS